MIDGRPHDRKDINVMAKRRPYRLLSIAHSYCVELNRSLARELARAGAGEWEVTAVAPSFFQGDLRPIALERSGCDNYRLEAAPAFLTRRIHVFFYGLRLRQILREGWDLVHCWEEPYILAGGQIAWWTPTRTPYVFWTGRTIVKKFPPPFSLIERYCVDRCAGWMARGELGVRAMAARGYGNKPHCAMPLGVDTERFRPDAAARKSVRARLGWDDNATAVPVIGFMGRFVPEKGLAMLMRVLDRLRSPWRALFLGGGPMEPQLRDWAAAYKDQVHILAAAHAEVPAYLNAMDLLCAPSQTTPGWSEIFGRMLIEAFACGVAVVAADSGEIPSVVSDAGVIVAERDENAWVNALEILLASRESRLELAARGRHRACADYGWPAIAKRHLDFFSGLLAESGC
jgi:glycosyltransferase involved in cell wall biosynthesis